MWLRLARFVEQCCVCCCGVDLDNVLCDFPSYVQVDPQYEQRYYRTNRSSENHARAVTINIYLVCWVLRRYR